MCNLARCNAYMINLSFIYLSGYLPNIARWARMPDGVIPGSRNPEYRFPTRSQTPNDSLCKTGPDLTAASLGVSYRFCLLHISVKRLRHEFHLIGRHPKLHGYVRFFFSSLLLDRDLKWDNIEGMEFSLFSSPKQLDDNLLNDRNDQGQRDDESPYSVRQWRTVKTLCDDLVEVKRLEVKILTTAVINQ